MKAGRFIKCKREGCIKYAKASGYCPGHYATEYHRAKYNTGRKPGTAERPSPEDVAKAKQMRVALKTWRTIGAELGWTPAAIRKAVEESRSQ